MQLLFINFEKKSKGSAPYRLTKNTKGAVLFTVFFTNYSTYEGEPMRLYRSPTDVRRDIFEIKQKIAECDSRLNIKGILTDSLTEYAYGEPEKWIPALKALVDEADETLRTLEGLKQTLDMLTRELEDTKCVLGI